MTTVSPTTANALAALNGSSTAAQSSPTQDMSATFLKLLVTQMQNQDPLNPMDNAQVTSQMAQINTVSGIQQLNTTMTSVSSQFTQMQALEGASLVGHKVLLQGNSLTVANGTATAGFELSGPADQVKVEVLSPSGRVIDTLQLGAQGSGQHGFQWTANGVSDGTAGLSFRVTATAGAATIPSTPLVGDVVSAVSTSGNTINLELASGTTVPYSSVKAIS